MISYKLQIAILQINTAASNFTGDQQQKTFQNLICSVDSTPGLRIQWTFTSVLNSILSVAAILGNALILIALHKESSLHPPSKLLLRSLATTDLGVGLILLPLMVTRCMSIANEHWNMFRYASTLCFTMVTVFCGVSMLTLTAISVDRLLALLLGLRYRQVVTLKRTYVIVIAIWVLCTVSPVMKFWNHLITLWCSILGASLCLVISSFSYTKIFLTLRHHQNQVQDNVQQANQTNQLHIARYKKAVSTAIWLQLTLVACYLPFIIVIIVVVLTSYSGLSSSLCYALIYSGTLVFLNSSLNPILYCWKQEEVRQAVKDTIGQMLCLCFSS